MSPKSPNDLNFASPQIALAHWVADAVKLPVDALDEHADLISQGLNSVQLMGIVGKLRKQKVKVKFAELLRAPNLAAWKALPVVTAWFEQHTPIAEPASESTSSATAASSQPITVELTPFELAPMQHAYWIGRQPQQYLGGVAAHFYHEFDGQDVVPEQLEQALIRLFQRHPMLRVQVQDDGLQQILPFEHIPWNSTSNGLVVHDLRALNEADAQQRLLDIRGQLSHRQLRIDQGEVFDIQLSRLPDSLRHGGTRLHINLDMVAADAFSLRVLLEDLGKLYLHAESIATPPGIQTVLPTLDYSYPQYQAERRELLTSTERKAIKAEAQAHWQTRIASMPGAPLLPTISAVASATTSDTNVSSDKPSNTLAQHRVVRRHCNLSPEQKQRLTQHASEHGLTLSMALASVLAEVLTGFSDTPDFLLNLPLFDREPLHPDVNALVGDFTSSILLQWQGSLRGSFVERAKALQQRFHDDVAHASYSGVEVLRDMSRLHGETVYAPVVFTSALGLGELFGESVRSAFGDVGYIISQGPQVWLDVQVMELKDGLSVNWDAREAAFAPGVLDTMFAAYENLLERLIARADNWQVPAMPMLTDAQQHVRAQVNHGVQPMHESERAATPYTPPHESLLPQQLHEGFFQQAKQHPERTALFATLANGTPKTMSYAQLADDALRVATYLQAQGVQRGDLVGILLPKGPEQITAVLGVLAAGAAYLPLGIDAPQLRRERIINAAGVTCVLDDVASILSATPECTPLQQPCVGEASDLAYIIFTSGSTGEPKGVEISHMAAWNTIADINRRFDVNQHDKVLAVSALDFDLSVYDIFGLLSVGGALVLVDESERRDAERWQQLVNEHQVTLWNTVPALLDMLLTMSDSQRAEQPALPLESLRLVFNSGDWIGLDLPDRLKAQCPHSRFIAMGGATEASIWSNHFEITTLDPAWRSIPYGFPLANQAFRVVDVHGRDCPDWVSGELWIGGAGVALGYRGAAELSAQRFVTLNGERWYRTGDMGRYWPNGCLEFLGRQDNQVKVRGHRIELGEIEAALLAHDAIAQAVVLLHERSVLAVVILADDAGEPTSDEQQVQFHKLSQLRGALAGLADFLGQRLTSAMTPSELGVVQRFPLTANGKLDRGALSALATQHRQSTSSDNVAQRPQTDIEQRVATVWQTFLQLPEISRDANFFALGGDSLLATRIVRHLRDQGLQGVSLGTLFSAADLAEFSAQLQLADVPENSSSITHVADELHTLFQPWQADISARHQVFEPTEVQRAYWLGRDPSFELGGIGCHFYREYEVTDVDLPRLQQALNQLIQRHEMLRAVFDAHGQQHILASVPEYHIAVETIADNHLNEREAAYERLRACCSQQVFTPSTWPLFDVRAVRCGDTTRLAIGLDNLILDAFSILLFYREWNLLYQQADVVLPPIDLSFRDYICHVLPVTATAYDHRYFEQHSANASCTNRDQHASHQAAQAYWHEKLPQLPPAPQLPTACEPADIDTPHFVRHQAQLSDTQWQHLVARAAKQGITPSCLLLTAFAEVLSRWSARTDLSLNLTLFDRREVHPDIYKVMGDFTSLTLVGYRPQKDDTWLTRAKQLQGEVGAALEHRSISSISLMRELTRRDPDANTTMPVVFTSALGIPGGTAAPVDGPLQHPIWALTQTPQVWLDHQVVEVEGGVLLNWDVVEALFPEGMCADMFQAYIQLLQWAGDSDWQTLPPDLLPTAQSRVRQDINYPSPTTERSTTQISSLAQPFFQQAKANPTHCALVFDKQQLSYAQLATQAVNIAHWLKQPLSAHDSASHVVAISLPKGPQQIAAVLGVLAAGAAYVPVSVDQPAARREAILARAGAAIVLDANNIDTALACDTHGLGFPENIRVADDAFAAINPTQLAYIIFTSGSTGEPKGVEISHAAAWNTINDINQRYQVNAQDSVLAISALEFDLSVYDIFGLLSVGGRLVLINESERRDSERWHELLQHHRVTVWNTVPALLDMLLTSSSTKTTEATLRLAMNSGDWIGLSLPTRLHQAYPECQFIAMGGATEASIWSNHFEVQQVDEAWRSIPYGYPLSEQRFRVVDSHGRDCPDWVTGELWIGGAGVALGYRGAEALTAERFVMDGGERWYRTGDLGRYWPNGCLEFLGRADTQVKIRGHRIELGEIEAALQQHSHVAQAVAMVSENQIIGALVIDTVSHSTTPTDATHAANESPAVLLSETLSQAVNEHLKQHLPHYMMPDVLVALPSIPLSHNGKVDRNALMAQVATAMRDIKQDAQSSMQPPQTEQEHIVAGLWKSLLSQDSRLQAEAIYREQSFFALGGDSLLATRFIERLQQQYGLTVPLHTLFSAPHLHSVAASLTPVAVPAFVPVDDDEDMEEGAI